MFQHSTLCDRFLITNNNLGLPKAENFDFLEPGNAISIKEIHYLQIKFQKKFASGEEQVEESQVGTSKIAATCNNWAKNTKVSYVRPDHDFQSFYFLVTIQYFFLLRL